MTKMKLVLAAVAASFLSTGAQAAVSYDFAPIGTAPKEGTTITFDKDLPKGVRVVGGLIQSASNSYGANPTGSSNYLTSNSSAGTGSASIFSDIGYKTISFDWGTIDSYNNFALLDAVGNAFFTLSGAKAPVANGVAGTRISLTSDSQAIYGLRIYSGSPAFEVDNVTLSSAVPEPATWGLMILGFGAVGAFLRRRSSRGTALAA